MDPNGNANGGKRGLDKLREIMLRNKEESEVRLIVRCHNGCLSEVSNVNKNM